MNLYEKSGYLNIPEIDREAERNKIMFIVIVGPRQVGKTYGTLQHEIKSKRTFALMRRTQTEADFIVSGVLNPFQGIKDGITVKKETQYTGGIFLDEVRIGATLALSTVSKLRGFSGIFFDDLIYDEFIPESHVIQIKNEGDAFLNAIVTLSGNRELEGKKPLKVWLLANANNFSSPILRALNIQNDISRMMNKGQELSIKSDRAIMIILPRSGEIVAKRKETLLYKALGGENSRFAEMAYENRFSYDDSTGIRPTRTEGYKLIFTVKNCFSFFAHKTERKFYVTAPKLTENVRNFDFSERGMKQLFVYMPDIRNYYIRDMIGFDTQKTKSDFDRFIYNKK